MHRSPRGARRQDHPHHRDQRPARRIALRWQPVTVLVIGLGMVIAPFAFAMFDRAPRGADMLNDFGPFMRERRLDRYLADLALIDRAVDETNGPVRQRLRGRP